ncbi:RNA methyltransferase [Psychroserpens sp.]|uniref:TrmH family RNA methyltransferase n=1 Tax=Psychroserpens sp. TaxID=2020870 RepID=UPI001B292DB4|nr:RNA methyltransferase [Psychroserpens sp.]MBO6605888.1 RNA methyltransferase [Psychroserpens sp.]MBO6630882.1 RNA methyltransferase [Psychroserpens sp.]MBO6652741.1 RNA methyltransferase [Psychroserpens sp.]MBO6681487.1 RNA methyltransferase [Psychroserpens sp.]MBO6749262.1 RNA methyltransferase [Psychroserpens sp.]
MLTKNHIKLITSLKQKKFRSQHNLFVVEGIKGIQEFLNSSFELHQLFAVDDIFGVDFIQISEKELHRISNLKSPNKAIALFNIPSNSHIVTKGLSVALDDVRDPGNLGTIIRLCDWFGIQNLICSNETVDCYNPKVVQATMGSLTRVAVNYVDLNVFIDDYDKAVFGTFMDGDNIYEQSLPSEGLIILGNEANGISANIETLVTQRITIPRFGDLKATESLNVATATGIVLSEFKRSFTEM